jgi:hypothetical protein
MQWKRSPARTCDLREFAPERFVDLPRVAVALAEAQNFCFFCFKTKEKRTMNWNSIPELFEKVESWFPQNHQTLTLRDSSALMVIKTIRFVGMTARCCGCVLYCL